MGLFRKIKEKVLGKSNRQKDKYTAGLDRPGRSISDRLNRLVARFRKVDEEYFEELIQILVESDISVALSYEIVESVEKAVRLEGVSDPRQINEMVIDKIFISYTKDQVLQSGIELKNSPTVVLVVGVNGVGKTTTIAKLAHFYASQGKKVLLAAGDTFRAAAVEQLQVWADRLGLPLVKMDSGADPASVMFEAVRKAKEESYDLVICDSAGRLQTKQNLMAELAKIARVASRIVEGAPHEVLLVLDATTGQNGLSQAKAFAEATDVTGIVLTKMDGTSKGGIILSIKDQFNIPVLFMGVGEQLDDLVEFDLEQYLASLFGEVEI